MKNENSFMKSPAIKFNNDKILKLAATNAYKSISKHQNEAGRETEYDAKKPPLPTDNASMKHSTVTGTPIHN
jgi:hypothetical protein